VAFVGRIAVEKNIGLFVLAAHALVQSLLPREKAVNFLVVGAGALQANVEELVRRLHIAHLFRFTGWVARSDLPTVLSAVDIVVNPSIRGWSETFCIANIEVMSMSIPLVTLAVGGVGQYVRPSEQTMRADNATLFSIGDNEIGRAHV
jgi:glycosyltransferase involved in cell wall biosynthesis